MKGNKSAEANGATRVDELESTLRAIETRITENRKEINEAVERLKSAETLYESSFATYEEARKKRQMALARREDTKDLDAMISRFAEEKGRLEDEIAGLKVMIETMNREAERLEKEIPPLKRQIVVEKLLLPLVEKYNTLGAQMVEVLESLERALFFDYSGLSEGSAPLVKITRIVGGSALDAIPALWIDGPDRTAFYERRALMEQLMREHSEALTKSRGSEG